MIKLGIDNEKSTEARIQLAQALDKLADKIDRK